MKSFAQLLAHFCQQLPKNKKKIAPRLAFSRHLMVITHQRMRHFSGSLKKLTHTQKTFQQIFTGVENFPSVFLPSVNQICDPSRTKCWRRVNRTLTSRPFVHLAKGQASRRTPTSTPTPMPTHSVRQIFAWGTCSNCSKSIPKLQSQKTNSDTMSQKCR